MAAAQPNIHCPDASNVRWQPTLAEIKCATTMAHAVAIVDTQPNRQRRSPAITTRWVPRRRCTAGIDAGEDISRRVGPLEPQDALVCARHGRSPGRALGRTFILRLGLGGTGRHRRWSLIQHVVAQRHDRPCVPIGARARRPP